MRFASVWRYFAAIVIAFNGVVKKPADLEYATFNDLYLINVDSLYELEHIDAISRKLKKCHNVCVRVEPNVPSATHAELVFTLSMRSVAPDSEQAEETCRRISWRDALCAFTVRLAYACGRSGAGVRAFRKSD